VTNYADLVQHWDSFYPSGEDIPEVKPTVLYSGEQAAKWKKLWGNYSQTTYHSYMKVKPPAPPQPKPPQSTGDDESGAACDCNVCHVPVPKYFQSKYLHESWIDGTQYHTNSCLCEKCKKLWPNISTQSVPMIDSVPAF
jgi:hypothetical protein